MANSSLSLGDPEPHFAYSLAVQHGQQLAHLCVGQAAVQGMMTAVSSPAANACSSCSLRKRKCDRTRPSCTTCARSGRVCVYEEGSTAAPHLLPRQSQPLAGGPSTSAGPNQHSVLDRAGASDSGFSLASTFRDLSLQSPPGTPVQRSVIEILVQNQAREVFASPEDLHSTAVSYFAAVSKRLPIVSNRRFMDRLASLSPSAAAPADFTALCLCMRLVLQHPPAQAQSMQSPLYITVKNIISLLESTDYLSIELCQCRLLVVFYEIGHGISPAASISIAACARTARALRLHTQWTEPVTNGHTIDAEERRRVWWAVFNLDKFINLRDGDVLFATEDPRTNVPLPFDDSNWAENIIPELLHQTLGTSSDITMGQFARECQISHLVGRVLRHTLDPASDPHFHASEELQLERTLKAFMPLLMEEESKYGQYCAALAICTSALFSLYDAAMKQANDEDVGKMRLLDSAEAASIRLVEFSRHLFADPSIKDIRYMSPLIPLSLYQAAMIQHRAWKRTKEIFCKERVNSLLQILAYFSKRWLAAGKYLQALDSLNTQ